MLSQVVSLSKQESHTPYEARSEVETLITPVRLCNRVSRSDREETMPRPDRSGIKGEVNSSEVAVNCFTAQRADGRP